jgi:hypothetical protein
MLTAPGLTALALAALLAGCSFRAHSEPSPPLFSWEQLGVPRLSTGAAQLQPLRMVAGPGGFWLLGLVGGPGGRIALYTSPDGAQWSESQPKALHTGGAVAGLAATGNGVWLLGTTTYKQVALWRYQDGWGRPVDLTDDVGGTLSGAANDVPNPVDTGIGSSKAWHVAAGPAGVAVVHHGRRDTDVWVDPIADAPPTQTLPLSTSVHAPVPTATGFLIATKDGFRPVRKNHGAVADITTDLLGLLTPVSAVNGDRIVGFGLTSIKLQPGDPGYVEDDAVDDNTTYRPRMWCAALPAPGGRIAPADVDADPGKVPDKGVSKAFAVERIAPHGDGFLILGGVPEGTDPPVAGLWTAVGDGCRWSKQPVQPNGFHEADTLVDVAVAGGVTVLVGKRFDAAQGWWTTRIWRSR